MERHLPIVFIYIYYIHIVVTESKVGDKYFFPSFNLMKIVEVEVAPKWTVKSIVINRGPRTLV